MEAELLKVQANAERSCSKWERAHALQSLERERERREMEDRHRAEVLHLQAELLRVQSNAEASCSRWEQAYAKLQQDNEELRIEAGRSSKVPVSASSVTSWCA